MFNQWKLTCVKSTWKQSSAMTHRHATMLKSGIHEPYSKGWYYEFNSRSSGKRFMDSWWKSEKHVVLEVSKSTKIIVYFQDANAMKKKILISSMVMFSWNQKVKNTV